MTPDELSGIEVHVNELAATAIKGRARSMVASVIADKLIEKYSEQFIKEVSESISWNEIRQITIAKITDRIVEEWRKND